jgi:hypothetical protein
MAQFIHYCAQNDRNGNPQRCYVLLDPDDNAPIAAWNEGYYGHDAVPGVWRRSAYQAERIDCSVRKYKELLRTLPSPNWAHDVPGYSHLRSLIS